VKTEVEKIDLTKAIEYLSKNIDFNYEADVRTNRPVTLTRVIRYAIDMLTDQWVLTNQGIGFDKNGVLIDGQKRLLALKMAAEQGAGGHPANPNISFETLVVRGLGEDVFPVIDTGETRNSHQILAMNGIRNGLHLGAAARLIYCFGSSADVERWASIRLSNQKILDLVNSYELKNYFQMVTPLKKIGLIGSSGIAGAYLCTKAMDESIEISMDSFLSAIREGVNEKGKSLSIDDPRWSFREYLIKSLSGTKNRKSRDSVVQLMIFIKCWNDAVMRRRRSVCSWRANEGVIRPVGWEE
jgi:hypothetical protein